MMPPSLRVLMTADAVGGVWVYAAGLARKLCEQGCRVALVTLGPEPRNEQRRELEHICGLDLIATNLALEWLDPEGRDLPRALTRLAEIERSVRPDVVHLNGYREAIGEWKAPVAVVAHSCVASWWRACRGEDPSEPRWFTYMANARAGLAAADRWVSPTAAFGASIQQLYAPPTSGHVIWNGIDWSLRSTAKEPIILAAGRLWDEAKNVAMLTAVAAPAPRRVAWPIRIAGPLSAPGVTSDSNTAGLEYLGELARPRLLEEMQRASIFVAPARYEPFGLTVLEAACAGCALVLSDIPSFRELWDGAALFVDPNDALSLQSVLTHLSRNSALCRDLQGRAVKRASHYSATAMAEAYRELYRTMPRRHAGVAKPTRRVLEGALQS